jgi:hypothetical protein
LNHVVGKKLRINDQDVFMEDANVNDTFKTYRVLHMMSWILTDLLLKNFDKFGSVVNYEEVFREG